MTYWLVTAAATTLSRSAGSTTPGEPLRHVSRSDARIELSDIVLPIRAVEARQPLRCRETDRSSAGSVAKSPLVPRAPRLGMRLYGSGRPDRPARGAEAGPRQAAPARPLGDDAGPGPRRRAPEPRDRRAVPLDDLHRRPGPRWPRSGRERVPGGHLLGGLHRHHSGSGGDAATLPAVLLPGWDPEPRRPGDARIDPRGRRARLRPLARVRRGVRQPGPLGRRRGRRRRGRDRTARDQLALEQVHLSLIHISEPTRLGMISYAV